MRMGMCWGHYFLWGSIKIGPARVIQSRFTFVVTLKNNDIQRCPCELLGGPGPSRSSVVFCFASKCGNNICIILWMKEILHHLGWLKRCKYSDKPSINLPSTVSSCEQKKQPDLKKTEKHWKAATCYNQKETEKWPAMRNFSCTTVSKICTGICHDL